MRMEGPLELCASTPKHSPDISSELSQPSLCSESQHPRWLGWECICRPSLGTAGTQGGDHRGGSRIPSISLVSALLLYVAGSPALACHSRAHQRLSIILTTFVFICRKLLMLPSYPMPDTGLWHQGPQSAQLEPVWESLSTYTLVEPLRLSEPWGRGWRQSPGPSQDSAGGQSPASTSCPAVM